MKTTLRWNSVARILARLVIIEALLMLVPLAVCLCYGESDWRGFAAAAAAAAAAGISVERLTHRATASVLGREGFISTALVWIVFGMFGMIPFMLSATPLGLTDALFEVISGFTTTGASMIVNVEAQSHGILLWRALTQWIGGLGIVLFMLAVLPELNRAAGISMFNAEATGITHSKLHPRIRATALSLWGVYCSLTVVSVALLWAGPMHLFARVCQTFAAVATGGFSTRDAGIAYWDSGYVTAVLTAVMFAAGLNFITIYGAWRGGWRGLARDEVVRTFTLAVLALYLLFLMSALMRGQEGGLRGLLLDPLFHIVSAITSTGFSIPGAEEWGPFCLLLTIAMMVCGACTGSTSGGIKIDRLIALRRNFMNEIRRTVFPKRAYVVTLNGTALPDTLVSRITAFATLYLLTITLTSAAITLFGYPLTDSVFMTCSCIGCNGLGYGATGAEGSFAFLPQAVKWMLMAVMLVGRLELFTFLVLLIPSFWNR